MTLEDFSAELISDSFRIMGALEERKRIANNEATALVRMSLILKYSRCQTNPIFESQWGPVPNGR